MCKLLNDQRIRLYVLYIYDRKRNTILYKTNDILWKRGRGEIDTTYLVAYTEYDMRRNAFIDYILEVFSYHFVS